MIPVVAASRTPISVTVIASPPRSLPNSFEKSRISAWAMPERSSRMPMQMNMGSATSTQLSIKSKMRSTVSEVYDQSTPVGIPR